MDKKENTEWEDMKREEHIIKSKRKKQKDV